MKTIFSFIALSTLILSIVFGQSVVKGTVVDAGSGDPLGYVNVGVPGKNVGTVTSEGGSFELSIPDTLAGESLKVSMIGYEPEVGSIQSLAGTDSRVKLKVKPVTVEKVEIDASKLKVKVLGNKTESKSMIAGFSTNELGNEVGNVIKIKKSPTYLKDFNVFIAQNEYDTVRFRLNFYEVKDGMPGKSLLQESIIVETTLKQGKLTVDLERYSIIVEDDFIVALEWIEDLGEGGLMFSAGLFGSPLVARQTSQGDWEKIGMGVSLGFNVTCAY